MKKAICNILACAVALLGGEVVADVSYDWTTYAVSMPGNIAGITPGIVLSWGATVKYTTGTKTIYNDGIFTIYRDDEIIGTVVDMTTFHDLDVIAGESYTYKIHGEVSGRAIATSAERSLRCDRSYTISGLDGELSFGRTGGCRQLDVSARSEIYNKIKKVVEYEAAVWSPASDSEWLEASKDGGTLTLTATKNDTGVDRTARLTISAGESFGKTFMVTQSASSTVVNVSVSADRTIEISDLWTDEYPGFADRYGSDFSAALTSESGKHDRQGNVMFVWQDYVAGTNPLDVEDEFRATVEMEDGIPVVRWHPMLSADQTALRKYTTYGATSLGGEWVDVSDLSDAERLDAGYHFFMVAVEMQ